MDRLLQKFPYLLELILNGIFVIYFTLSKAAKLPLSLKNIDPVLVFNTYKILAPICIFISLCTHYKRSHDFDEFLRKYVFSLIIFIPLIITIGDIEFTYWLSVVHLFSTVISLYEPEFNLPQQSQYQGLGWVYQLKLKPAQLVIISFALIVLLGALLLVLPIAANPGKKIAFVDALFMSTSATCVTGLATNSVIDDFSIFGQLVLLFLMQVGGLGIMTLSSSFSVIMGRSLGVREQVMMQDLLDSNNSEELLKLVIDIVRFTFMIEFIGAIVLTVGFYLEDYEIGQSLYMGFFHAISAFCNCGFALFNNNLEDFAFRPLITTTIAILIIFGGIGFAVIQEVWEGLKVKKKFVNYSLHTKIVLYTNFMLIFIGMAYLFFGEFLHAMEKMNLWQMFQVTFFQSVTTRTAGFNSMNLNLFHPHCLYMMILLMFIGASPGSTGGGVKTTTLAVLIQSIRATLKNKPRVEAFERTIPEQIVVRSIAIFLMSLIVVSLLLLFLMKVESDKNFLAIAFEAVSAFGTVGLSLGITPLLTTVGKLIIISLMYIGRVGPLTLILAVGQRGGSPADIQYPESKILIG